MYLDMKKKHHDEFNAFPMMFAFSEKQFKEGLEKLNVTKDELFSIGGGGFIRKTDIAAFYAMLDKHEEERQRTLEKEATLVDALIYELGNHEYCITFDPQPTFDALGLDANDEHVAHCFNIAREAYLEQMYRLQEHENGY